MTSVKLPFGGPYLYRVYVDSRKYDAFTTETELTAKECADVIAGYREALLNYQKGTP